MRWEVEMQRRYYCRNYDNKADEIRRRDVVLDIPVRIIAIKPMRQEVEMQCRYSCRNYDNKADEIRRRDVVYIFLSEL